MVPQFSISLSIRKLVGKHQKIAVTFIICLEMFHVIRFSLKSKPWISPTGHLLRLGGWECTIFIFSNTIQYNSSVYNYLILLPKMQLCWWIYIWRSKLTISSLFQFLTLSTTDSLTDHPIWFMMQHQQFRGDNELKGQVQHIFNP